MKSFWNVLIAVVMASQALAPLAATDRSSIPQAAPIVQESATNTDSVAPEQRQPWVQQETPTPEPLPEQDAPNTQEAPSQAVQFAVNEEPSAPRETEDFSIPRSGGRYRTEDNDIALIFPANVLQENINLEVSEPDPAGIEYWMSDHAFEINATGVTSRQDVTQFRRPIKIQVQYDPATIQGEESSLSLFYYDTVYDTWTPLISEVDTEHHILTGYTEHFSVFDFNTQNWQASMLPSLTAASVSNFTGAANYEFPIQVPEGPGGIKPSITLRYNSQVIDDANNFTQASWVGMGWTLETGAISRDMHETPNYQGDDTFSFSIDGISYGLLPVEGDPDNNPDTIDYRSSEESFWVFRQYVQGENGEYGYLDESYWIAMSPDGMKYYFNTRAVYPECVGSSTMNQRTHKWMLTKILNPAGMSIDYTYSSFHPYRNCTSTLAMWTDIEVLPQTITYGNRNDSNGQIIENGRFQIYFDYPTGTAFNRTDYNPSFDNSGGRIFVSHFRLDGIRVLVNTDTDLTFETQIRRYALQYTNGAILPYLSWDAGGKTLALTSVQEFGMNNAQLPTTTFEYGDYMHMTKVSNGYGGSVQYVYEGWSTDQGPNTYNSGVWGDLEENSQEYSSLMNSEFNTPTYKPGGYYRVSVRFYMMSPTGNWGKVGIHGFYSEFPGNYTPQISEPRGWVSIDQIIQAPANVNYLRVVVSCKRCHVTELHMTPLLTRYRVVQKIVNSGITSGSGQPASVAYTYSYTGASANDNTAYNQHANDTYVYVKKYYEFFGHALVTETAPDGTRTVTTFSQNNHLRGRPTRVDTYDSSNQLIQTVLYNYVDATIDLNSPAVVIPKDSAGNTFTDLSHYWIRLDSQRVVTNPNNNPVSHRTVYTYDSLYGNVTGVQEYACTGNTMCTAPYRYTATDYRPAVNATTYITSLPAQSSIYSCSQSTCAANESLLLSRTRYLYDNHTAWNVAPTSGVLTGSRSLLHVDGGTAHWKDELYAYDGWGNQSSVTEFTSEGVGDTLANSGAQTTTTEYDPMYHTYPHSQTNAKNQTTLWDYDHILGVPIRETDPNKVVTTGTYDNFGRLTSITRLPDTSPTITVEYHDTAPFWIEIDQRIDASTTSHLRRIYDGTGRLIQEQQAGVSVNGATVDLITDSMIRYTGSPLHYQEKQTVPYGVTVWNGSGSPLQVQDFNRTGTITTYDALGRTLSVAAPNSGTTTTSYTTFTTSVTGPAGNVTTQTTDLRGRVVNVTPASGLDIDYTYNEADQLVGVTTGAGVTTIAYDLAGRKTGMEDPDMGTWAYVYNALGALVSQTDARGCVTSLTYDLLNRLTGKTYSGDGACETTPAVSYFYDGQSFSFLGTSYGGGSNAIGRRTGMLDGTGATTWTYDVRGRATSQTKRIYSGTGQSQAEAFTTSWTYNSADLPVSTTYPDGEVVQTAYNRLQQPVSLQSSSPSAFTYVQNVLYDVAGRVTRIGLGSNNGANILTRNYSYYDWGVSQNGGRLQSLTTTNQASLSFQNIQYSYDSNGNILQISNSSIGENASYTYDALNRLTSAAVTGQQAYTEVFQYNPTTGNLAARGPDENNLLSYTYDPNHVHAASSYGDNTYAYDANGNQITRNLSSGAFDLTYDAENHLVQVMPHTTTTPTQTATATMTATITATPTETSTETATPAFTETPVVSETPTETQPATSIPTETPVFIPTETPEGWISETPTETPVGIPTAPSTETSTPTFTETPADTITALPAETATETATMTLTETGTPTETWTLRPTSSPTATITPVTPTDTSTSPPSPTLTPTLTQTLTNTPSATDSPAVIGAAGPGIYDNSDPHVVFQGAWINHTNLAGYYQGTFEQTDSAGASMRFQFNGTQVSLAYSGNTDRGLADVYIDGTKVGTLNQNIAAAFLGMRWFSDILPQGEHTLELVYAAGQASARYIGVDYIVVSDPATTIYDDTASSVTYSGTWAALSDGPEWNRTRHRTNVGGSSATFNFTGSRVHLVYTGNGAARGITNLYIDDVKVDTLDMLEPAYQQGMTWSSDYLTSGAHTLRVEFPTGQASDKYAVLDAFIVENGTSATTVGAGTYDDLDARIQYLGPWMAYVISNGATQNMLHQSDVEGARMRLQFTGGQVSITYSAGPGGGLADIYLDGEKITTLNQYAATGMAGLIWSSGTLAGSGPHTLEVRRISGQGIGKYITIDTIAVTDPTGGSSSNSGGSEPALLRSAQYFYDGDGTMVKSIVNDVVTYYPATYYIKTVSGADQKVQKYYAFGTLTVAVRTVQNGTDTLNWLLSDHLGSTSTTANADGTWNSEIRYTAFGEVRYSSGITPTDYRYTGQLSEAETGLYFYNSRWYDPSLNRFIQPDSIVPAQTQGVQAWDRYAYVNNNPIIYADSNGHFIDTVFDIISLGYDIYDIGTNGLNWENGLSLVADAASLIIPGITGGGALVRAATHVDDAVDAVRAVNHAVDSAQVANRALDTANTVDTIVDSSNAIDTATDASRSANNLPGSGTSRMQQHHFASNKNKHYTSEFNQILNRFGLNVNDSWNIGQLPEIPHRGRHPNRYHEWILINLHNIETSLQGCQDSCGESFINIFYEVVIKPVMNNPSMVRKSYWIQ